MSRTEFKQADSAVHRKDTLQDFSNNPHVEHPLAPSYLPPLDALARAKKEGYESREIGRWLEQCPYEGQQGDEWREGWQLADRIAKRIAALRMIQSEGSPATEPIGVTHTARLIREAGRK